MRQMLALLMLMSLLMSACSSIPSATPPTIETYKQGEPITFLINDTVYVCTDQLPYSIVQITESGEREVMLEHSCVGIVGTGADQYCENGQIKTEFVGTCSDAILCEEQSIRETITWDQQEYVEISEECAGETIRREIRQQVPAGRYQVVVRDMQNDQVTNRAIKELIIVSNESAP